MKKIDKLILEDTRQRNYDTVEDKTEIGNFNEHETKAQFWENKLKWQNWEQAKEGKGEGDREKKGILKQRRKVYAKSIGRGSTQTYKLKPLLSFSLLFINPRRHFQPFQQQLRRRELIDLWPLTFTRRCCLIFPTPVTSHNKISPTKYQYPRHIHTLLCASIGLQTHGMDKRLQHNMFGLVRATFSYSQTWTRVENESSSEASNLARA